MWPSHNHIMHVICPHPMAHPVRLFHNLCSKWYPVTCLNIYWAVLGVCLFICNQMNKSSTAKESCSVFRERNVFKCCRRRFGCVCLEEEAPDSQQNGCENIQTSCWNTCRSGYWRFGSVRIELEALRSVLFMFLMNFHTEKNLKALCTNV